MKIVNVASGLSGSGKSVVAKIVAEHTGAKMLRTDVIRLELPEEQRALRTTPEGILAVYLEMMKQARAVLGGGESVVLDGTFLTQEHRDLAVDLAAECSARLRMFVVECPDDIAEARIIERARAGVDPSEAGIAVRRLQQGIWQPPANPYIRIDAGGTPEDMRRQVMAALR